MGRRPIFANPEERKKAKREYTRAYRSEHKEEIYASQLKHWAKKLKEAGYTVTAPDAR